MTEMVKTIYNKYVKDLGNKGQVYELKAELEQMRKLNNRTEKKM